MPLPESGESVSEREFQTRLGILRDNTLLFCPAHKTLERVVDVFRQADDSFVFKLECGLKRT